MDNVKPICENPQDGCMSTGGGLRLCTNPAHREEPDYATRGPVWHHMSEWSESALGTCKTHRTPHPRNKDCRNWKIFTKQRVRDAASELLEACKMAQMFTNKYLCPFGIAMTTANLEKCDCNYHSAARQIESAINKATGQGE